MTLAIPDAIFNELDRLCLSFYQDPCSGLTSVEANVVAYTPEGIYSEVVEIYDDHAHGLYDGLKLLDFLKTLKASEVNLSGDSIDNIWQKIKSFEV